MTRRVFCKILLVVVAILGLFVLSGVLSAQGNSDTAFERVKAVQEAHTNRLMAIKDVEGTAIGFDQNNQPALKVFTAGPGVRGIPKTLDGVAVQVVVTGKIYALVDPVDPTARFPRPVPIGVSTGHPDITAGTIGCRVKDGVGNLYALSNNHVYANSNNATRGDNVLQPGSYDGGVDPDDAIGTLSAFEPIVFGPRGSNTMDAAIALCSEGTLGNATPADDLYGYGTPSSGIVEATLDLPVQKYGRTTGQTYGEVTGINATVKVRYSSGFAIFVNQIIIEGIEGVEFSAGGDSGSLIVTNDESCDPVGLLFAGNSTVTIANAIGPVLQRFGVTIDGDDTPPPPPNDPPTVSITSPADGSTFDSGAAISFVGTASDTEDGDLTASLVWTSDIDGEITDSFSTTLTDGTHTITASVTDFGGKTATASINITVGTPPSGPTDVIVDSISYSTERRDRDLLITVALVDNGEPPAPVSGASVSINLSLEGSGSWVGTDTTGTDGTATFTLKNAKSGTYTTEVTSVTAAGLSWDGDTPDNSFTK